MLGKLRQFIRQRPWRAMRYLLYAACYGAALYVVAGIGPVHLGIDWVGVLLGVIGYLILLVHVVLAVWMFCRFGSIGHAESGSPHRPTLDDSPFMWRGHSTIFLQDTALQFLFFGLGAITASVVSGWIAAVVGFALLGLSAAHWLALKLALR